MEFLKKNFMFVIITVVLVLFIVLSLVVDTNKKVETVFKDDVNEWLEVTKEGEPVVAVLSQTWCGNCKNFKPVMEDVVEEHEFDLYWFEIDVMEDETRSLVTDTYSLDSFTGTPYMFIVQDGEFVVKFSGSRTEENIEEFLKEYGVI